MVALNFSGEFAGVVSRGLKRQTIRRNTQARIGDRLQLYTGQRTKNCAKLIAQDPVVIELKTVELFPDYAVVGGVNKVSQTADDFARADGFADYKAMWAWFAKRYQCDYFTGVLIRWQSWSEAKLS